MRIDIHAHTSNHPLWGLHTTTANLETLERHAQEFGISQIVLMATYFPFKRSGLPNRELAQRIQERPLFRMFGSLDVVNHREDGLIELRELLEQKTIAGIKLYPGYQKFRLSDPKVYPVYALAERYGVPVAIHTGELHACCSKTANSQGPYRCGEMFCWLERLQDWSRPQEAEAPIRDFPEVPFVLAHLGNPYFEETQALMARYPNVYTDLSGQWVSGSEEDTPAYHEQIQRVLREFLTIPHANERLLFATDFPIQSYADSVRMVQDLHLSPADEARIFYQNAQALLNPRK